MLATVNRSFGRGRRPWGRRIASGGSRWTQTTSVGGMGSEGRDGVGTLLCRSWFRPRKRGELAGAEAAASKKTEGKKEKWTATSGLYSSARSAWTRYAASFSCQHKAEGGRRRAWKTGERTPAVGRWSATVPINYRIATEFILQITLKFSKEDENLKKMKVAQLFKLYNFASMNIFKFCLHFEIWIWGAFEYLNHFKITPNFICKLEKLWIPKLIHIK